MTTFTWTVGMNCFIGVNGICNCQTPRCLWCLNSLVKQIQHAYGADYRELVSKWIELYADNF